MERPAFLYAFLLRDLGRSIPSLRHTGVPLPSPKCRRRSCDSLLRYSFFTPHFFELVGRLWLSWFFLDSSPGSTDAAGFFL